ncbi:MAG: PDZ domain-containing protein [Janthinobacterium lividum]
MRFLPLLGLSLLILTPTFAANLPKVADPPKAALDTARRKVYPALVNIAVVFRYYDGGRAQRAPAGGSGVIISPDGYVLTNFHVAGHTTHITCTLASGESLDAQVIADDPLSDLSVLKLRRPASAKAPLPYAILGNSDLLQVGDPVLAMGNPLMLSSSMTLGIVSNPKRVFTDFSGTEMQDMQLDEGEKTGTFTRWIQHDALILPGNSGGPLVNLQGEVIGINELGGDGVGFAIPSNLAKQVFMDVLHYGKVPRGWIGLRVMPVSKMGRTEGALVSSVTPDSPASRAGIQPGDLLMALDNAPVTVRFFEQIPVFYQRVARLPAGHIAHLSLVRAGKMRLIDVRIAPLEPSLSPEQEFRGMGVTVRALTADMALDLHLPDTQGVLVTGVRPGLPFEAAQPPIAADDVIKTVNGQPTPTVAAFRHALDSSEKQAGKDGFSVTLVRKDENLLSIVKNDTDKAPDDGGDLPQAWMGIKTQVLTPEVASAVGLTGLSGFRVTEVFPYTEAAKAGLKPGDVLTALNGAALTASHPQDAEDFTHQIEALSVGDKAQLGVRRGAATLTLPIVLEPTPDSAAQAKTARSKEFEFAVRGITLMDKVTNHWDDSQKGVVVTEVTSGGWAAIAGLHTDDLILSLNGHEITDAAAFERVLPAMVKEHPKIISVFVRRDVQTQFVFLEPDWTHLAASE